MSGRAHIPRLVLSPFGPVYLVKVNPWVPVWWSVALPGFGHLRVGQNLTGLLLITWEILVNTQAQLNLAIFYSVLGQFDRARAILDYRWAVVYPLVYIFAIVDSYPTGLRSNATSSRNWSACSGNIGLTGSRSASSAATPSQGGIRRWPYSGRPW